MQVLDDVPDRLSRGAAFLRAAPPRPAPVRRIAVGWASDEAEVREAQALRHQVFGAELGARLAPPPGTPAGLDADRFDPYCDHLIVRAVDDASGEPGNVIGTYRVLGPAQARAAGAYYTDGEFDLAPLAPLRRLAAELGRSCVHHDWRLGAVMLAMWGALAGYMDQRGLETMIGCASMSLADGGVAAQALWRQLRHTHLAERCWHVRPHAALPLQEADDMPDPTAAGDRLMHAPPLIRGYLRCGARVLGPPALDRDFNTADLPMMLRMRDMAPRYRRHLLGAG